MKKSRLVVHLGLNRNNGVQCHLVQICGRLIPFCGPFEFKERHLKASYWCGEWGHWAVCKNLKEWKDWAKEGHEVVRFQRVTYTVDSLKKGVR